MLLDILHLSKLPNLVKSHSCILAFNCNNQNAMQQVKFKRACSVSSCKLYIHMYCHSIGWIHFEKCQLRQLGQLIYLLWKSDIQWSKYSSYLYLQGSCFGIHHGLFSFVTQLTLFYNVMYNYYKYHFITL